MHVIGYFFILDQAILTYINSSFLSQFIPIESVGLVYIISSLITIGILANLSKILLRFGNFKFTASAILFMILVLIGLGTAQSGIIIIILFILYYPLIEVVKTNFDLFLEEVTDAKDSGAIRGQYLTWVNLAWLTAPLVITLVLVNENYWQMYLLAAAIGVVALFLVFKTTKNISDVSFDQRPFWRSAGKIFKDKDLSSVLTCRFLFDFFLSWMVIYVPIYLNQNIGFSWGSIGILIFIAMSPYVLFEFPLGKLADTKFGEKEIMVIGFVILSLSTVSISIFTGNSFLVWAIILFGTRTGASFVEIMTDTYYFKKIEASDTNALELFRDSKPAAYIAGALFGSILIALIDIRFMFAILAVILLSGIYFSLRIKDTL